MKCNRTNILIFILFIFAYFNKQLLINFYSLIHNLNKRDLNTRFFNPMHLCRGLCMCVCDRDHHKAANEVMKLAWNRISSERHLKTLTAMVDLCFWHG